VEADVVEVVEAFSGRDAGLVDCPAPPCCVAGGSPQPSQAAASKAKPSDFGSHERFMMSRPPKKGFPAKS